MRVGDVLRDGSIVVGFADGEVKLLDMGRVVIHKSRLRRALRLGWHQVPPPAGGVPEKDCVIIERSVVTGPGSWSPS